MKMSKRGAADGRATGRIGLVCLILFGVVAGFNSMAWAQDVDVANAYTTAVGSALPGPDLPPEGYGTYTPYTPEPLAPPEGAALRRPAFEGLPPMLVQPGAAAISPTPNRFQWGLSLLVRGVYDDNINLAPPGFPKQSDWYVGIQPAIAVGFGDVVGRQENYIRLDYAPEIDIYTEHSEDTAVQHLIRFESQYRFSRLTLHLTQDVQILSGTETNSTIGNGTTISIANVDVAGRTDVNVYRTYLGAAYVLTDKTFLSSDAEYGIYDYNNSLISSERFIGHLFFNYIPTGKLVLGIGGGGGIEWGDSPTPDQPFGSVNARITYQATGKISLYAMGGVEFRDFEDQGTSRGGTYTTGTYELGATWQPFDGTLITLRGNRRNVVSAVLPGQDFTLSNIIAGVRQRLFGRVYLGVTGGYEHDNYFSAINGVNATRDDDYWLVEPSLDVVLFSHPHVSSAGTALGASVGIYYIHRKNDSNFNTFDFVDNQVGIRAVFVF
jgi:opacity protein-like surface antigen